MCWLDRGQRAEVPLGAEAQKGWRRPLRSHPLRFLRERPHRSPRPHRLATQDRRQRRVAAEPERRWSACQVRAPGPLGQPTPGALPTWLCEGGRTGAASPGSTVSCRPCASRSDGPGRSSSFRRDTPWRRTDQGSDTTTHRRSGSPSEESLSMPRPRQPMRQRREDEDQRARRWPADDHGPC